MTVYHQILSHFNFFAPGQSLELAFQSAYDPLLVFFSLLIAYLAAYSSLVLLGFMSKVKTRTK